MKVFAKIAAFGIAAAIATTPAHAGLVFDFGNTAGQAHSGLDGPNGNIRTYSATDNGQTVNVRVSGWNTDGTSVQNAFLGAYQNAGLGVTNRNETGNGGSHAIDNIGSIDFIILQFDQAVSLNGAFFNAISQNGIRDTDATFAFGNAALAFNSAPGLHNANIADFDSIFATNSRFNSFGSSVSGFRSVNAAGSTGNIWAISALAPANGLSDSFKLRSVSVSNVAAVPEPATWAMMILGFGLIGGSIRSVRRKQKGVLLTA